MDCGFRGLYALWEEDQGFSDLLVSNGVKFIKYDDDFPDGCVTWSFMGNAPRFPESVHTEKQKRPVPTQWAMLE